MVTERPMTMHSQKNEQYIAKTCPTSRNANTRVPHPVPLQPHEITDKQFLKEKRGKLLKSMCDNEKKSTSLLVNSFIAQSIVPN